MTDYIYVVMGEDGDAYGSFLDKEMAKKFKDRLSKEFGPNFYLDTVPYGPRREFAHFLNE